ncbi:MAG TPA: AAA family ATPase, partial [Taishania sp.]|nr:AAA family ATPase [Taishania sp.]
MLQHLKIQNFALIQQAKLNFDSGYTVITGETGSGKSILLQAINLILGERADYKIIGPTSEKAVVEATFVLNQEKFGELFNELDVDFDQETIIRREITKAGKSRAFINDTPVQLAALKSLSEQLISIHSQYNTLDLKRREFQMQTLDVLAGTKTEQLIFAQEFQLLKSIEKEIDVKR